MATFEETNKNGYYHLAVVVGGMSFESNAGTLEAAQCEMRNLLSSNYDLGALFKAYPDLEGSLSNV